MGRDTAGRAVLKYFYGRSEAEVHEKAAAWLREHPNGLPPVDQQVPLNHLIATWVETCIRPPTGKIGTYEDYLRTIKRHIAPTIGLTPIYKLRLHDINQWLRAHYEATGHGRTTEKCHQIIHAALEYAVSNEIIPNNPAEHAKVPRYEKRRDTRLSREQALAFIDAAYSRIDLREPYVTKDKKTKHWPKIDPRLGFLFELAVIVGPRRGELLALRYSDLQGDKLHITRQIDTEGRELPYTKTDAGRRVVKLDAELLTSWRAHRAAQQAEGHQEAWKPDGLLFPTTEGTPFEASNLRRLFKSVLAAAGLPDMRFHDLRHTAASLMIDSGASPTSVAKVLGHRTANMVIQRYAHGGEVEASEAISRSHQRVKERPKERNDERRGGG